MQKPTIHLNGTGATDLFKQYADGVLALREALRRLPVPHGRDYYVQEDGAYERARAESQARADKLREVLEELEGILEGVAQQRDARGR